MQKAVLKNRFILPNIKMGTGAAPDPEDKRDLQYNEIAMGAAPVDWEKGYDVEKVIGKTIKRKNQNGSSSCVGQGWSFYLAVLNAIETGRYDEVSAKSIYSQIFLGGGGAYIREGAKLAVNWGALYEDALPSYDNGEPPTEAFITDKSWKTPAMDELAKTLQSKEYRVISGVTMEMVATAIRDNYGVVGGVSGGNNGTWGTFEPKPPVKTEWGHCIYYGKFGIDKLGKYIATPNSWGTFGKPDALHPDGWQKLREDYFRSGVQFNPWTLTDKPNFAVSPETEKLIKKSEKKVIIEAEGRGRKGVIVNGVLREVNKSRTPEASLYVLANNDLGSFVSSRTFDEIPKGDKF